MMSDKILVIGDGHGADPLTLSQMLAKLPEGTEIVMGGDVLADPPPPPPIPYSLPPAPLPELVIDMPKQSQYPKRNQRKERKILRQNPCLRRKKY